MREVLIGLVLAGLSAQVAATTPSNSICSLDGGVSDVFAEPILFERIALGTPIVLHEGAILASETFGVATKIWRLDQTLKLAAPYSFSYPAGARVTALMSPDGAKRCLRDAVPLGSGPRGGQLLTCLIDEEGDGSFEAAELFDTSAFFAPHAARFVRKAEVLLSSRVTMREDNAGLDRSRMNLRRRLRVVGLSETRVTTVAEDARESVALPNVLYDPQVNAGKLTFRKRPLVPQVQPEPTYRARAGSTKTTVLEKGQHEIAAVPFRIARDGQTWSATPLADRFPQWLSLACDGTQLRASRPR